MANYNPDVLKRHANTLYVQAAIEILILTSLGLLGGYGVMTAITPKPLQPKPVVVTQAPSGMIPSAAGNPDTYHNQDNPMQYLPIAIGGILGLLIGYVRSNSLRIKAQGILCQVAIEENTNHRMPAQY